MVRGLLAASVIVVPLWGQDLPVISVAGGGARVAPRVSQPPRPPGQLPPLPVTQIDPRDTTLDSPRRISLTFLEPRPIDEVLGLLTAGTPYSVSIDSDATGVFRGELKQLTLREALLALLAPLGLDVDVRNTVIRVRRRQLETRLFDLNMLNVQRGLSRATGAGASDPALGSSVAADDIMGSVAAGVQTMLSQGGRVHVDRRAGLAQVTDYADRLDRVALYIETLHQRGGRQVRLQAQVFEVTLLDTVSIDWRAVRQRVGLLPDAPDAGLAADPAALRTALALQGDVRVLWTPDVTTLNNEPAMLRLSTPGATSLTLSVVPQISADGIVQLSIAHAWEEHAGDRKDGWFKSTPLVRSTGADTVTRVMDGHTVMISGLRRPTEITIASSGMFGKREKTQGHAELVVLLRPTVVTPGTFVAARN